MWQRGKQLCGRVSHGRWAQGPASSTAAVLAWGKSSGKPCSAGSCRQRGRGSGSEPFPVLSQLGSGIPGVLLAAVGELLQPVLMARHGPSPVCVSGQQQHVLLAPYPSMASYPNTSHCPRVCAPPGPGERPLGLRGEAETESVPVSPRCCFSRCQHSEEEEVTQGSHLGFFWVAESLCIGWCLERE